MNSKDVRGLAVLAIGDGTKVGTIDHAYLDLAAKRVVGFSISGGVGPFGGAREGAPTVAASGVRSMGPDALTLDDVAAAHAAWTGASYGPLAPLDELAGRKVVTEGGTNVGEVASIAFDDRTFDLTEIEVSPGFFKTNKHIPIEHLVRIGQDVLVVADAVAATEDAATPRAGQREECGPRKQR